MDDPDAGHALGEMMAAVLLLLCVVAGSSPAWQTSQPQPIASGFGAGAYPYGTAFPSLDKIVEPKYPEAAIQAGVEGEVLLEAVVGTNGTVREVRITKSLDTTYGLDNAAADAVKEWKFRPATLGGKAVAVMSFARVVFYLRQPGSTSGKPFVEAGLRPGPQDTFPEGVLAAGKAGVTMPMLVKESKPKYTPQAMRAKIQGLVVLEVIVGKDGSVAAARVMTSLDSRFGLDNQALEAVKQWKFTPARLNGEPVPARIQIQLEFRLN